MARRWRRRTSERDAGELEEEEAARKQRRPASFVDYCSTNSPLPVLGWDDEDAEKLVRQCLVSNFYFFSANRKRPAKNSYEPSFYIL